MHFDDRPVAGSPVAHTVILKYRDRHKSHPVSPPNVPHVHSCRSFPYSKVSALSGAQVQEKLVPSVESALQLDACGLLGLETLLISSMAPSGKLPMTPLLVLSVA